MNRHERRKAQKTAKTAAVPQVITPTSSPIAQQPHVVLPDDLKADIARVMRGFILPGCGTCFTRAVLAEAFLCHLGIPAKLALGGMVYRAGPDPVRDSVGYCGPGNVGQMIPGKGWLGHYWVQSGHEIVDFSVGDWRTDTTPDMLINPEVDDLGPIEWTVEPPDYFWVDMATVAPIRGQHTPELGRAFYTGWYGPPPPTINAERREVITLYGPASVRHWVACSKAMPLKERVQAAYAGQERAKLSPQKDAA